MTNSSTSGLSPGFEDPNTPLAIVVGLVGGGVNGHEMRAVVFGGAATGNVKPSNRIASFTLFSGQATSDAVLGEKGSAIGLYSLTGKPMEILHSADSPAYGVNHDGNFFQYTGRSQYPPCALDGSANDSLEMFAVGSGGKTLVRNIALGAFQCDVSSPVADSQGNIYLAEQRIAMGGASQEKIVMYSPKNDGPTPTATLRVKLRQPQDPDGGIQSIGVDGAGRLYVLGDYAVYRYNTMSSTQRTQVSAPSSNVTAFAVDQAGDVYTTVVKSVSDAGQSSANVSVVIYPNGGSATRVISGPLTGLNGSTKFGIITSIAVVQKI